MGEDNKIQKNQDPTSGDEITTSGEVENWESKYQEESKQSKSYRQRAQKAEAQLTDLSEANEVARQNKLADDGKLSELVAEQKATIESLTKQAEAGNILIEQQKLVYLNELPEEDREEFKDLPLPMLAKIVGKISKASRPEIPAVKGATRPPDLSDKPYIEMNEAERRQQHENTLKRL